MALSQDDAYAAALRDLREAYDDLEASLRRIETMRFEMRRDRPETRIDRVLAPEILWDLHALLHMAQPLRSGRA
jgi:hypothetical protein